MAGTNLHLRCPARRFERTSQLMDLPLHQLRQRTRRADELDAQGSGRLLKPYVDALAHAVVNLKMQSSRSRICSVLLNVLSPVRRMDGARFTRSWA